MGTKERREREKLALRDKILNAARELFVEKGYEAVSMRMIADRIEYSPTAIYLHFRDKDALFQELCHGDFMSLAGVFRQIARVGDPVERLRQVGQLYGQFAREKPNHYRLMFMTPRPPVDLNELQQAQHGNPEEDAYAFLVQTVRDGCEQGCFRPELCGSPEQLAQLVWAGVHGVVSLRIAKCHDHWIDWADEQESVGMMIDLMFRSIVRDPVPA
ncbi:MAG TPA: TetR/AcrR family transcriptional regulator [Longimicrobium sp.]|nr:TetR/AcrR family transcriptional regulator [Longimicrobium sp.]